MDMLETDRLQLRRFHWRDIRSVHQYAKHPGVGPPAGWKPHENLFETAKAMRSFRKGKEVWAITLKSGGKVIGSIGLHPDRKRQDVRAGMLGYVLAPEQWGHGYTTEAAKKIIDYGFESMKLDVISVCHYPQNLRSKRVIEKCGFTYEGTLRRAYKRYDGRELDECCYSILRQEWKER